MKTFTILLSLLWTTSVFAFPEAPFNALEENLPVSKDLKNSDYDFEGIVKLSNCSGAVVRFAGQPLASNAYVLTNGHCIGGGFLKPGEAVANKLSFRRMRVSNEEGRFFRVRAQKLIYATMTGTDAAIYELNETYDDLLKDHNIEAFDLDASRSTPSLSIDIVSGYWERGYSCSVEANVFKLLEANWIFKDSLRYSEPGCDTIGGTSGSPIIEKGTRSVVGVNNTSNEGETDCSINNPCEQDENRNITVKKGYSYGQQIYQFYACLTMDFDIDTSIETCELTKP